MASLSLRHINKFYSGGVKAVSDFSLEIADKEFLVLVGPSGCGKSTTLRMIAGLEEISQGELYIGDRLVNTVQARDRDIAMVFQNYALYPHMTVFDNMAFGLRLRKVPLEDIEVRVDDASKTLGIQQLLERRPRAMSGGQRQRVALGRSIVRSPKVFLLDEPLSNLDTKLRVHMRTEIVKLYQELQTTFIYVTHDQVEAMTMGTRIVVMKDGFIQQVDTPQNLYDNPVNLFVAGFIGTPQMNFIDAELTREEGLLKVKFGSTVLTLSSEKSERLKDERYIGQRVIVGIRPEDFKWNETIVAASPKDTLIEGEIDIIENLGNERIGYVKIEGKDGLLITRTNGRIPARRGEKGVMAIQVDRLHLFAPDTEKTLLKA